MKPILSQKSITFKRIISPVRQIMDYADPIYFEKLGLNSAEVISFAGGWVNHEAPEALQQAYQNVIKDNDLFHKSGGYSPTMGTPECKEAIVNYEKHLYGISSLDSGQIAVGASSTQLTSDIMKVLLNPGDKVLLLDPTYCNFPRQIITALDVKILRFPVIDPNSWEYVADKKIEEFCNFILTEKPKVILLVTPDNPTSQVLSDKFVKAALDVAKETGSFLVLDFAYKDITFADNLPDYYSWEPNDNFLSIHSNSKWSRNLGRRLGWIEASKEVIEAFESILGSSILCPDALHQMALVDYLNSAIKENTLKSYVKEVSQRYQKAGQRVVKAVETHLGLPCLNPQGGIYTCIKVKGDGSKFVEEILKNTGVLFVPGWGFGRTLKDAVRVSFGPLVNDLDKIDEGMRKVEDYLKDGTEK